MAAPTDNSENIVSGPVGITAAADLQTKQFYWVKMTSSGANLAGDGEACLGVLVNKPDSGQAAAIAGVGSTVKVIAGAAVTIGARVGSDSNGKCIDAATADLAQGICVKGCSNANEYVSVFVCPQGAVA